jgi:hypothetical protein
LLVGISDGRISTCDCAKAGSAERSSFTNRARKSFATGPDQAPDPAHARLQGFWTAKRTLAGIETMAMLAKGQVRAVPKGDMPAQRAFVQQIFCLTA